MLKKNNYVVILAGGIGSRFWPRSRQQNPKQFLDILGVGQSLIQMTFERLKKVCYPENIYVVTHQNYTEDVKKHLPDLAHSNIISEPYRKNTGPSALYISKKIASINEKANIMLCPADHLILNEEQFIDTAFQAFKFSEENEALLTLGIKPLRPDTGYGYIQFFHDDLDIPIRKVKTFTEKPILEIAESFIASGDFLWNSGIFFWNTKTILPLFREYMPEINELFIKADFSLTEEEETAALDIIYQKSASISIDHGLLEKAPNVFVMPSNFGWSDLGTWESAYQNSNKDYLDNAVHGKNVVVFDTSGSLIQAPDKKLVVVQGLEKYIVIDTEEILLICERNKEQEIKNYVAEIKRLKGDQFI